MIHTIVDTEPGGVVKCSPQNVAALLTLVRKQHAKIERLRSFLICIETDFDASPSVRALARRALEPKP